jgi:hypothetical protein
MLWIVNQYISKCVKANLKSWGISIISGTLHDTKMHKEMLIWNSHWWIECSCWIGNLLLTLYGKWIIVFCLDTIVSFPQKEYRLCKTNVIWGSKHKTVIHPCLWKIAVNISLEVFLNGCQLSKRAPLMSLVVHFCSLLLNSRFQGDRSYVSQ